VDLRAGEGTAALAGLRVEREDGVVVIALAGEHDIASRDSVQAAIVEALEGGLAVVIDLRDAYFIDSVIAAVFLDARKVAKHRNLGLGFLLSSDTDNGVRRMFELSTLTTIFAMYPTREAAVAGVRGG
jgi:anti-anti-sigma factor